MPIQITCPKCQAVYNVPEEQRGKRARCKKCETVFVATAAETQAGPPVAEEVMPQPSRPDLDERNDPPRRRSQPEREDEPRGRRRQRPEYDEDFEEDDRPLRQRRKSSGLSSAAVFLIVGGVVASLLFIAGGIILVVWMVSKTKEDPYAHTRGSGETVNGVPGDAEEVNPQWQNQDKNKKGTEVKDTSPP